MVYLSKLAKRLALAARYLAGAGLVATACAVAEEKDFLGPDTSQNPVVSLTVSPEVGTVRPGEIIHFSAIGRNSLGQTVVPDVEWSTTGGTIGTDGVFVSDRLGQFQVSARLRSKTSVADSAVVSVFLHPKDVVKLTVAPEIGEITTGEGVQITARAELADGTIVTQPPLAWSAAAGQIDGNGYYTAPQVTGDFEVKADASSGVTGVTKVKVNSSPRSLVSIEVTPASGSMITGQSQQFQARGVYNDGSSKTVPAVWNSTGGSISSDGLYTAGSTPGSYRVIGRFKQGTQADTALIEVRAPQIVGVSIAPDSSSLTVGGAQQFVATARMSDGSTRPATATWQATGGSITSSGYFTAGSNPGNYRVVGTISGGAFADTARVTISAPTVTLAYLDVSPSSVYLPAGTGKQFNVLGKWSDSSTSTPPVTWSATGGTITSTGAYKAGTTAGTFSVIARSAQWDIADTATVTIGEPDLITLVIQPATVTLAPAQAAQFSASGTWTDGGTATPSVTWTAEGGVISSTGRYTAGSTGGTFRVVARHSGGKADTSLVTVTPPQPVLLSLSLSPATTSLAPGGSVQFSVTGSWSEGGTGTPSVTYSTNGGTISSSGLYTAPDAAGTYRVIAKHTQSTKADTSTVTVASAAPTLTSLSVSPDSTSVQTGNSRQFAVSGRWSDGSTATPAVSWTTTGGTISAYGLYTAPQTTGTYRVIARQVGGTKADTAKVTVTAASTIVSILLTPGQDTVPSGQSQQFKAMATYSNGGTGTPAVNWAATGGSITSTGLYTAGSITGSSFRVIAQASGASASDTAKVQVDPPVVSLAPLNRPSTHTNIFDINFDSRFIGWSTNAKWEDPTYLQEVSDAGAPRTKERGLEFVFPVGFSDLTSPARASRAFTAKREVYAAYWIKISKPWQYHTSSVNKLFFIGTNASSSLGNEVVVALKGTSESGAQIQVGVQTPANWGAGTRNGYYEANANQPGFSLGRWHLIEVHAVQNLGGLPNGKLTWWVDGVMVGRHTNVLYNANGDAFFDHFILDPNWGGQGSPTKTQRDWIRLDHLLVTGR
jgi:hypothetical protein